MKKLLSLIAIITVSLSIFASELTVVSYNLRNENDWDAAAGNGFGYGLHTWPIKDDEVTRTISARYHKDGAEILIEQPGDRPRKLSVKEAMQLQGYDPKLFEFPVSATQAYHQIGNSVVVPAIAASAKFVATIIRGR